LTHNKYLWKLWQKKQQGSKMKKKSSKMGHYIY
jgi:hypothetical protein